MKRNYHNYTTWEDYKNGMYNLDTSQSEEKIYLAKHLLTHLDLFYEVAQKVIICWPIATSENLTNTGCNREAWLGQASCSYKYGVPEILTRVAWKQLTEEERINANKIASLCIKEYENTLKNGKEDATGKAYQMMFRFE
jgi:hypothetical protein